MTAQSYWLRLDCNFKRTDKCKGVIVTWHQKHVAAGCSCSHCYNIKRVLKYDQISDLWCGETN